jgi:hypothetical protein
MTLFENGCSDIQQLLKYAINGQKNKVKSMLDKNPELLLKRATVVDFWGRVHVDRTVYQIALGMRDYDVLINIKDKSIPVIAGMVGEVKQYFSQLKDGETDEREQREEQLSPEQIAREEKQFARRSETLKQLMRQVIASSDENCSITLALDSFHGYDFCNLSNEIDFKIDMIPGVIYLKDEKKTLKCYVISPSGKMIQTDITWDNLPNDFPRSVFEIVKLKYQWGPDLLRFLSAVSGVYETRQCRWLRQLSDAIVNADSIQTFNAVFNQLKQYFINQEIVPASFDFDLLKAIYQFRYDLAPKPSYITGHHSEPRLFLETLRLQEANYAHLGGYCASPKNLIWCQKIMSASQRELSVPQALVLAQDPSLIIQDGQPLTDSYFCALKAEHRHTIFSLDTDPIYRWGYNCLLNAAPCAFVIPPSATVRALGRSGLYQHWQLYLEQIESAESQHRPTPVPQAVSFFDCTFM